MSTFNRLLYIVCLSSGLVMAPRTGGVRPENIELGLVNFETLKVARNGEAHNAPTIVVRATNQASKVQSFGLSNEAGIVVMPLPQGTYSFDAFSESGHSFQMRRPLAERWFVVKEGQVTQVGVEIVE